MIRFLFAAVLAACTPLLAYSHAQETGEEDRQSTPNYAPAVQEFLDSLTPITGAVELPGGRATLNVPDSFYYLSPTDAERVLTEAWGNPPGIDSLGMLFPAHMVATDSDAWAVNIYFDEIGYVSDADAADTDYDALFRDLQRTTRAANEERVELGFEPIELLRWSPEPRYDADTHQLYWGKILQFGDSELLTLNYEAQTLGRRGVLVMNFIAGEDQLDLVLEAVPTVLAMPEYHEGHRYLDFDPELDQVAAYGIGGLIAGGILQKAGIFAILLAFLKKGWVLLFALAAGGWRFITGLFKRKTPDNEI